MGIGNLGFENNVFKRKFRYTVELQNICGGQQVPKHYVKMADRPNISIEPTEINFLNAKSWIPGKASWETITLTYYDVANTYELKPLYDWLASVYNFADPRGIFGGLQQGSQKNDYAATAIISLWDGCGEELERWTIRDAWPEAVNFDSLDYSDSEAVTIELTLRYSDVFYQHMCPNYIPQNCCSPCGGIGGGLTLINVERTPLR